MFSSLPLRLFSLTMALLMPLAGCDTAPRTSDKDLQHVDYHQLKEWLAQSSEKRPLVLVDIRSVEQYQAGHLPGAIHIPLARVEPTDSRFRKVDKIVFYHDSFTGLYADLAAKKLIAGGVYNAYSYGGGYVDWKKREGGQ